MSEFGVHRYVKVRVIAQNVSEGTTGEFTEENTRAKPGGGGGGGTGRVNV